MGIIGGADGPTAIYIASSINWGWVIAGTLIVLAAITAVILRKRKNKRSK